GTEWQELPPLFHVPAMQAGCLRDDTTVAPVETKPEAGPDAIHRTTDPDTVYRNVLTTMLERNQDGDFTKDALPNINVVAKLAGFTPRKEDVLRVFRQMKAEAGVPDAEPQD